MRGKPQGQFCRGLLFGFQMEIHENTILDPNFKAGLLPGSTPCLKHCVWSAESAGGPCRWGQQKGKAEVASKPKDQELLSHWNSVFLFCGASGHHPLKSHIHPYVCSALSRIPTGTMIRCVAWRGSLVSVMSGKARGTIAFHFHFSSLPSRTS